MATSEAQKQPEPEANTGDGTAKPPRSGGSTATTKNATKPAPKAAAKAKAKAKAKPKTAAKSDKPSAPAAPPAKPEVPATPEPAARGNESEQDDEDDERLTRDQETHDAVSHYGDLSEDDYEDDWKEPELLGAPDPRPGFTQRFVATQYSGEPAPANVAKQMNKGWKPRRADTIPAGFHMPTLAHGQFAGCCGVEGQVLMERPVKLHKRFADSVRQATKAQRDSVKNDLHVVHQPGSGLGQPELESKSSVARGRPVKAADD